MAHLTCRMKSIMRAGEIEESSLWLFTSEKLLPPKQKISQVMKRRFFWLCPLLKTAAASVLVLYSSKFRSNHKSSLSLSIYLPLILLEEF